MYAESDIKTRIALQFSKAASDYEKLATVQWQIARYGLELYENRDGTVLDLGCGTGRLSAQLATTARQVLGVDIAPGMIDVARQRYSMANTVFQVADAENLPFADNCIDSVFSSMALQWCQPLDKVFQELFRIMKPGASGMLAIMAQGSLEELNLSWQKLGESAHINTFESEATMHRAARTAGLRCSISQQRFTSWHKDIFAVLHSIKDIGASVLMEQGGRRLSRRQLQRLQTCYRDRFAQAEGLPLSYQIVFLKIEK